MPQISVRRVACALVALTAVLAAARFAAQPAFASSGSPPQAVGELSRPSARASDPPYPSTLIVKSELRLKADLISRNLKGSPQLVFFGGSRSQRFDPDFARRLFGLRAVNISLSNARPEAAWAYANWFYSLWPNAKLRWVWGMQPTMLRDRDLDPALLQDSRFYPYFPEDLLASQRQLLPASVAEMPHSYGFERYRFSSLGMTLWNTYDLRVSKGYTLDQSLDDYIAKMLRDARRARLETSSRADSYLEQTLELLNAHGTTPVIVLMPIHPRVLRVMAEHNMGGGLDPLREYLAGLTEKYDLKVLDFTRIQSFQGQSSWFYDGVHITRSNANRIITALKTKAGAYLE